MKAFCEINDSIRSKIGYIFFLTLSIFNANVELQPYINLNEGKDVALKDGCLLEVDVRLKHAQLSQ